MDILQRFKNYLGLSTDFKDNEKADRSLPESIRKSEDELRGQVPRTVPDNYDSFGFNVFSNPIEMHRYFEHQMHEMLKNFGIFGSDNSSFGNFGEQSDPFFGENPFAHNGLEQFQFPSIEDFNRDNQPRSNNLRDQYLKPGYEMAPNGQTKIDKDVDERFNSNQLDSILKHQPHQIQPKRFFFGKSMTTKTIRNADGSIESEKTVRDQDGNEETIITKRQGDKEYSVTTKINKNGEQEISENSVNLDEHEKELFLKRDPMRLTDQPVKVPSNYFPYDKFF